MKAPRYAPLVLALSLGLGACVTLPPSGPSMTALPGTGKSFDQFRASDLECRSYASNQSGGSSPGRAAEDSAIKSVVAGTAIGALAGAAIGGSHGAALGAGTGMIVGGLAAGGAGAQSARGTQRSYDAGYVQCMYGKGHKVPVSGRFADPAPQERRSYSSPPPNYPPPANNRPYYPPPAPGTY